MVMYNSNVQDEERTLFEAHEKYLMDRRSLHGQWYDEGYETAMQEMDETISQKDAAISEKDAEIARLREQLDAALSTK